MRADENALDVVRGFRGPVKVQVGYTTIEPESTDVLVELLRVFVQKPGMLLHRLNSRVVMTRDNGEVVMDTVLAFFVPGGYKTVPIVRKVVA